MQCHILMQMSKSSHVKTIHQRQGQVPALVTWKNQYSDMINEENARDDNLYWREIELIYSKSNNGI